MANKIKRNIGYHCKGNVMTPLNWFTGIVDTALLPTAALQHDNWLGIGCFTLVVLFGFTYIGIYLYFVKKDPDRLQSEEFNLHQQEILIESGSLSAPDNQQVVQVNTLDVKNQN